MKRQYSLTDYFYKKTRTVSTTQRSTTTTTSTQLQAEQSTRVTSTEDMLPIVELDTDFVQPANLKTTCRVLNSVYGLAKTNRPLSDIEYLVEIQIQNGLYMGRGLHTRETAGRMVEYIAEDIKRKLFSRITEQNLKICLIIDEHLTVASTPVLILYVKVEGSTVIFVDLVELEKQDAETIFSSVMESLSKAGLTKNYLKKNLIGFCSDGGSVLLGRKSGASTRIAEEFPNIIIWHCLNHRLPLVLDDSIKEVQQVNHFEIFIDKMYNIFLLKSVKSQAKLQKISEELELELIKIGTVLGPTWSACSLRTTQAVWRAYPALHQYFSSKPKYSGMAARLENIYFLKDLALMIDILTEISLLSNALQAKTTDILKAEKLVLQSIKAFEMLQKEKGAQEKKVTELMTSESCKNITFVENQQFVGLPREGLLENIITNLRKRLTDCGHLSQFWSCRQFDDSNKLRFLTYLEPEYWKIEDVDVPWKEAEDRLIAFEDIFHYQIDLNDYRDFLENVLRNPRKYSTPESVKKAHNIVKTLAVSSEAAERGLSKMNEICSEKRSHLTVSDISSLMTVSLLGLPVEEWDPVPTAQRWLEEHCTADDAPIRTETAASEEEEEDDDIIQNSIWQFLR